MDPTEPKPHSAEYFGKTRDYWWNLDFLELMVRRWNAQTASRVLDAGCGQGHWGQLLCEVLPPGARLTGVDREPTWVERARQRAAERGMRNRCDYVDVVRLKLTCERGKRGLGLGDNSLGDLLPGWLAEMGLESVQVYLSDKATPMHPPYQLAEQAAFRDEMRALAERDFWCWPRDEASRYFVAGGGAASEFEQLWARVKELDRRMLIELDERRFHCAGGSVAYLVSARKPG